MHRAARPLTTRETVLLIVHAAGDHVAGRTVMQKLAYFCGLELRAGFGHRPHYFGPFSAKVEDAITNAVIAGELSERIERISDWSGGPDAHKYVYALESDGKARVERLLEEHQGEWERIQAAVEGIMRVVPDLDQKTLSSAAKTYLIVSESEEGVDEEEVPRLAKRLGWDLDTSQVKQTVTLLDELGLLAEEAADQHSESSQRGDHLAR